MTTESLTMFKGRSCQTFAALRKSMSFCVARSSAYEENLLDAYRRALSVAPTLLVVNSNFFDADISEQKFVEHFAGEKGMAVMRAEFPGGTMWIVAPAECLETAEALSSDRPGEITSVGHDENPSGSPSGPRPKQDL